MREVGEDYRRDVREVGNIRGGGRAYGSPLGCPQHGIRDGCGPVLGGRVPAVGRQRKVGLKTAFSSNVVMVAEAVGDNQDAGQHSLEKNLSISRYMTRRFLGI